MIVPHVNLGFMLICALLMTKKKKKKFCIKIYMCIYLKSTMLLLWESV